MNVLDALRVRTEARSANQIAEIMGVSVEAARQHLNKEMETARVARRKVRIPRGTWGPVWGYYLTPMGLAYKNCQLVRVKRQPKS